jgi:hypothetical protein
VSATEDDEGAAQIVSDAMQTLILDVEQLLKARGWSEALAELKEGDDAFAEERWRDAVRECYRAAESGLKYRLVEAGAPFADSAALRRLTALAVQHDLNSAELPGHVRLPRLDPVAAISRRRAQAQTGPGRPERSTLDGQPRPRSAPLPWRQSDLSPHSGTSGGVYASKWRGRPTGWRSDRRPRALPVRDGLPTPARIPWGPQALQRRGVQLGAGPNAPCPAGSVLPLRHVSVPHARILLLASRGTPADGPGMKRGLPSRIGRRQRSCRRCRPSARTAALAPVAYSTSCRVTSSHRFTGTQEPRGWNITRRRLRRARYTPTRSITRKSCKSQQ